LKITTWTKPNRYYLVRWISRAFRQVFQVTTYCNRNRYYFYLQY